MEWKGFEMTVLGSQRSRDAERGLENWEKQHLCNTAVSTPIHLAISIARWSLDNRGALAVPWNRANGLAIAVVSTRTGTKAVFSSNTATTAISPTILFFIIIF